MRLSSGTWVALAITATASTLGANAGIVMTGGVAFGGVAVLDNPDPTLATSVSIPLAFGGAAIGSFTPSIGVGTPIAFTSPLVNGVTSGLIWSGGAGPVFTFTASGPVTFVGADPSSLGVTAVGIVDDGPGGFDPTPALFDMAITKTAGVLGAFGSVTTVVPEPGAFAMMAGLGLLGFTGFRRSRA